MAEGSAGKKSTYKASTYAASGLWLEHSKVEYAANPKKGKSFDRYAAYEKAATIGEALKAGALPADLLFDYEKGHLKVLGPLREKPLDIFTLEDINELTYTDKVLCRYSYYSQPRDDQSGAGKIQVLEESLKKQRATMKRLGKIELARQLDIGDVDSLNDSVGFWETPVMMAKRSVAAAQAQEFLDHADATGGKITDFEVLQVLRLWDFRENETRKNVMREGQTFVYSDTIGFVADRTGHILAKEETKRYPQVGVLFNRWLKDHIDREHLGTDFVYTSININKNYAGRLHRDGNNVGPSFLKAFGNFSGGQLNYFPEDDRSLKIEDLDSMTDQSSKIDVKKGLLLFDGKRGHFVDDFEGERYSLVFFTCPRFEKASDESRQFLQKAGFPLPTAATMESVMGLLRKPKGYGDSGKKGQKAEQGKTTAPSLHDAPWIYYSSCTPELDAAEARAEEFWNRNGLKQAKVDEGSKKVGKIAWEHTKNARDAKWVDTMSFQLPGKPSRKDLILEGHKNLVDAVAFLSAEEAKAPKAVAKEGCCAILSNRTKVWYALYARGHKAQALAAFRVEATGARQACAKPAAPQATPPSKRAAPAGREAKIAQSSEKRRRTKA
ncbi:unnamed protein product [Prorocentrum cordatum]|uniref:Uncharacterized protein n=1 Tax=Prorocentrum cordatum TaxID=2364126 RepID=A0ABN9UGI0_9DINO|nr:unnamed protein product [Polarella glacialis]|mmetsp:Transcript_22730/g.59273  ORF Transcript_22730/g.59273 Transcript_22730/m.59273 type:complete len:610 (-) Transcript_22730:209-2038(-)